MMDAALVSTLALLCLSAAHSQVIGDANEVFLGDGPLPDAHINSVADAALDEWAERLPVSCEDIGRRHGGDVPPGVYDIYSPDRYELREHGFQMLPTPTYCPTQNGGAAEGRVKRDISPVLQPSNNTTKARDCADIFMYYLSGDKTKSSGVYRVYNPLWYQLGPDGLIHLPIYVYCDMKTSGGGWTVFQRRHDGSVNFTRVWHDYEHGFGALGSEFWLGLRFISMLTAIRKQTLLVEMTARVDDRESYALYNDFSVADALTGYKLTLGCYTGNDAMGNMLTYHSGAKFSTIDRDQDSNGNSCAKTSGGGNWFKSCYHSNLNGVFTATNDYKAINWKNAKGVQYEKTKVRMSFRPDHYQ